MDSKPIQVVDGELPAVCDETMQRLAASGLPVFDRGGELVRPVSANLVPVQGLSEPLSAIVIAPVTEAWLCCEITRAVPMVRFDKRARDWLRINCPPRVAKTILELAGSWPFPPLRGILEAPTLRPDGTVLGKSGYDKETGLYLHLPPGFALTLPKRPTRAAAEKALAALADVLEDFPFSGQMDYSVALAAILTAILRRTLPTAPGFLFDAPVAGSGKSLLADIVAILATGRGATVLNLGQTDEETEKRLDAAILRGTTVLNLDNVERPLTGERLASLLTGNSMDCRVLGASRLVTCPTNLTILATGNNISVTGDLRRRFLSCRIDPQEERPDQRTFSRDLRSWAIEHRAELISAALTVLRAHYLANRPAMNLKPYGSFEVWSLHIRAPLVWLGWPDPCETRSRLEDGDRETTGLTAVLETWNRLLGRRKIKIRDLIAEAEWESRSELKEALLEVSSGRDPDKIDPRRLSAYFRRNQSRIIHGLRLERSGKAAGLDYWEVAEATP